MNVKLKKLVILALVATFVFTSLAFAKSPKGPPSGPAGKSPIGHLYLFEKDSAWDIVEGGAWGKMQYNTSGPLFKFVFNGHGLNPGDDYTLIYYPDPWPGTGLICLGSNTADGFGNVHIAGAMNTGDLPASTDANTTGAKIWLVLSSDVDCSSPTSMIGWDPSEYLFEHNLITYDDTDD